MGKAEELAAAIEGLERSKRKRRKYPAELRQKVIDYVREQRASGVQLKSIGERLGVSPTLLHRWELRRVGKFRRVEVKMPPAPPAPPASTSRCVLHASRGVRVEGLAVDELVEILRRLA
jgi:transposase-like protein